MEINEAAVVVAGPRTSASSKAIEVLWHFVRAQAKKARATDDEAEDIAQDVLSKIVARLQSGDHVWGEGNAGAYLRACARNGVRSNRRRNESCIPLPDEVPEGAADSTGANNELGELSRGVLEKAAGFERARRMPRYRADFDGAWAEMQAIFYDNAQFDNLLRLKLGEDASDDAYLKARQSAYKAHQRVRESLGIAIQQLRESGELTAQEADLASKALQVFVRCQRKRPPSVRHSGGTT